jgi:purine-binding chemotaxis protein CheW
MNLDRTVARGAIDWGDVRRRVDESARELDAQAALAPERRRAILEARARALAVGPPPEPGAAIDVLEFVLAGERYAIGTEWVREVRPLRELTRLPGAPAFVLGIVHLRGEVMSILDLKKFFDLPDKGITDLDEVIVLDDGAMCFGILADRIEGVRRLPLDDVQPPLATLVDIQTQYLLGVTCRREILLDGRKLLGEPSIVVGEGDGPVTSGRNQGTGGLP